ncbi:MAG: cyclic-di-AMP receptor [Omnitrophica WOR_2 bacterium]
MKLMIIIIRDTDAENVVQELVNQEYRVTRMASTGGFLRRGNITLLVGVENEKVDHVIELLKKVCFPPEDNIHRATVFVSDMPYFAQI